MGVLRVWGTLDVNQFWPKGVVGRKQGSDPDTIRVVVDKSRITFNGKMTKAFANAYVIDRGARKKVINGEGEINVRLQGVDAPELHYPTTISTEVARAPNGHFRQCWSETATKALAAFLKNKFGSAPFDCEVVSQNIGKPNDVCDSHGRVVGNVLVKGIDINLWLLDQGWAFPTFYDSMLPDEIEEAMARAKAAKAAGKGVWVDYTEQAFFDPHMEFRRTEAGPDRGKVLLPKLFRRCSASHVTHGSLVKLMPDIRKSTKDKFAPVKAFLQGKKTFTQWGSSVGGAVGATSTGKVKMQLMPWELVLKEEPSTLYRDVNGENKKVATF